MNDVHQVDLKPLKKYRFFFWQVWATNKCLLTSHFYPHFFHSTLPKDTPMGLLVFTLILALQHELKRDVTNVPIQNAYLSLYMPLSLQLGLLSFCHQPSTSTLYRIYSH
jgi:hypothetical protein